MAPTRSASTGSLARQPSTKFGGSRLSRSTPTGAVASRDAQQPGRQPIARAASNASLKSTANSNASLRASLFGMVERDKERKSREEREIEERLRTLREEPVVMRMRGSTIVQFEQDVMKIPNDELRRSLGLDKPTARSALLARTPPKPTRPPVDSIDIGFELRVPEEAQPPAAECQDTLSSSGAQPTVNAAVPKKKPSSAQKVRPRTWRRKPRNRTVSEDTRRRERAQLDRISRSCGLAFEVDPEHPERETLKVLGATKARRSKQQQRELTERLVSGKPTHKPLTSSQPQGAGSAAAAWLAMQSRSLRIPPSREPADNVMRHGADGWSSGSGAEAEAAADSCDDDGAICENLDLVAAVLQAARAGTVPVHIDLEDPSDKAVLPSAVVAKVLGAALDGSVTVRTVAALQPQQPPGVEPERSAGQKSPKRDSGSSPGDSGHGRYDGDAQQRRHSGPSSETSGGSTTWCSQSLGSPIDGEHSSGTEDEDSDEDAAYELPGDVVESLRELDLPSPSFGNFRPPRQTPLKEISKVHCEAPFSEFLSSFTQLLSGTHDGSGSPRTSASNLSVRRSRGSR
eukprot:gnl/TRDRNA2_/TRDRNA2_191831_c0_seq1.p1 gnl/TRDRNA2_/TRDRNA2_191831_c0~~gnl/TRDRNA2_/TRDRNA2_191831_c0_seq1.p1  ORF type:complete len:584 (+),score=107.22 gnl/TRDRNA2_/TRDRNA2_191831_c0_seq1:35-1753(+)